MVHKNDAIAQGCSDDSLRPRPVNTDECYTDLENSLLIQQLPKPISGLSINPNAIELAPLGAANGGAFCLPADLNTLTEWLQYIEKNIIRPYCDLSAALNCSLLISRNDNGVISVEVNELRRALVSCLGLDDNNPHIIYDPVTDTAIAGKIDSVKPDCAAFIEMLKTCPPDAPTGQRPERIIGYTGTGATMAVARYTTQFKRPTRFWATVRNGYGSNNYSSVAHDQRLLIKDTLAIDHEPGDDGGIYNSTDTSYTFGTAGYYRVTFSAMLNFKYSALAGWIIAPMTGIYHLQVSQNAGSPPAVEYRLDETTLYLSDTSSGGQDVTIGGSILIRAGVNDVIRPRVWFSNTNIPSGGTNRNLAIWINKSAETVFSIARENDNDMQIIG